MADWLLTTPSRTRRMPCGVPLASLSTGQGGDRTLRETNIELRASRLQDPVLTSLSPIQW